MRFLVTLRGRPRDHFEIRDLREPGQRAALLVGNVLALARPPVRPKDGELRRAPTGRSLVMAFIGLIAAVWALGSLLS